MNRYDYKNSIEYKKYCIKALLKIKKYNILNKIRDAINILKELFNFEEDIKEDYNLDINLNDYMPAFYSNMIYDYLKYSHNKFINMTINTLNNTLYYINKTINAINKTINDLYYALI